MSAARKLRVVDDSTPAAPSPTPESQSAIDAWAAGIVGKLPQSMARSRGGGAHVAAELIDHVRERVRELQLEGLNEHAAVEAAISEFGDPGVFAKDLYRAHRRPSRRRLMNTVLGMVAGAAVIGGAMLATQPSDRSERSSFAPRALAVGEPKSLTIETRDKPAREVLGEIAKAAGLKLYLYDSVLVNSSLDADHPVNVRVSGGTIDDALRAINLSQSPGNLDYRVVGDTLEIATYEYFARRETRLACLDLGEYLDRDGDPEKLQLLIQEFVHKSDWQANGGDLAEMSIFDRKVFLRAPERTIQQVEWVIGQLSRSTPEKAAARAPAVPDGTYVVAQGDSWRSIARERLGNADAWMAMAWANRMTEPSQIEFLVAGTKLKMPTSDELRATYVLSSGGVSEFVSRYSEGKGWRDQLMQLNPRMGVDWVPGRIVRLPSVTTMAEPAWAMSKLPGEEVRETEERPATLSPIRGSSAPADSASTPASKP